MDKLLNINYIKKNTPNLENLKVTLKKDTQKGNSLYATKPIKKGNIVGYYRMKVYDFNKDTGPFGETYHFTVYTKNGKASNKYIGNLYEGSVATPSRNIPFWAYFSNEPSGKQKPNAFVDENIKGNYRNRDRVKEGDIITYKLIAARNINPGEEIVWCYGDEYIRKYKPNC